MAPSESPSCPAVMMNSAEDNHERACERMMTQMVWIHRNCRLLILETEAHGAIPPGVRYPHRDCSRSSCRLNSLTTPPLTHVVVQGMIVLTHVTKRFADLKRVE